MDEAPPGSWRVIAPASGGFLQGALTVDSTPRILHPTEALINVSHLLLDSTSMKQLRDAAASEYPHGPTVGERIANVIRTRGKMHNPVTNSGGVLAGTVMELGAAFPSHTSAGRSSLAGIPS